MQRIMTFMVLWMGIAFSAAAQTVHTEDVELFYKIYEAANGRPSAEQLQRDYLDAGSAGLKQFAKLRNITGARIADNLTKHPTVYANAKRCLAVLPRIRQRTETALRTLIDLYPEARLPPITIAVGRGKPVGVGSPATGLQIGLEALCATEWLNPDIEDRFVNVIAHEYAHVQQREELVDKKQLTVLEGSLMEGAAEFVAELMDAEAAAYSRFTSMTAGREHELETAFLADLDKTDISKWLYNGTMEKPGDLGYWIGYRIVKSYYRGASDKRQAVRDILEMPEPRMFLERSGWRPGVELGD